MKGNHKIEVRSGRVVFTIELERNITILRGDSATGKTTLVEMLQAYETYGRQSGVTVSCDKPCRVLSGVNWELQLSATHDSIVFVDEGSTFSGRGAVEWLFTKMWFFKEKRNPANMCCWC